MVHIIYLLAEMGSKEMFGLGKKPPVADFIKTTDLADVVILKLAVDHFTHGTWNDKDIQIILDHIPDEEHKAKFRAGVDASLARIHAWAIADANEDEGE